MSNSAAAAATLLAATTVATSSGTGSLIGEVHVPGAILHIFVLLMLAVSLYGVCWVVIACKNQDAPEADRALRAIAFMLGVLVVVFMVIVGVCKIFSL